MLLKEQKSGKNASRDTKDQLLIDNDVIRNCNRRKTNLNMTWVDFRKAYGMVPHMSMIKALKLIHAAPNVIALLKSTLIDRKTELILGRIGVGEVNINKDTFQGDSLSLLLFIISVVALTLVLR